MQYKGSLKHKNRPGGAFGTICPDWSHHAGSTALGVDIDAHPWQQSTAQELLDGSIDGYDGNDTLRPTAWPSLPNLPTMGRGMAIRYLGTTFRRISNGNS